MHHCLLIPEITTLITEQVCAITISDTLNLRSTSAVCPLVNLAQTCRVLSEPSLNSLWKIQTSLVPLLRTMPADLWEEKNSELVSSNISQNCLLLTIEFGTQHTLRPIHSADWARFQTYAARIYYILPHYSPGVVAPRTAISNKMRFLRSLAGSGPKIAISPSLGFLQALASAKPRDILSLCPRLVHLTWKDLFAGSSENTIHYMPLFMGLSVTKVEFSIHALGASGTLLCAIDVQ